MWCPEGYVTLGEVISQIMWESDIIPIAHDRPDPPPSSFPFEQTMLRMEEIRAFQNWAVNGFLNIFQNEVRICLASGNLVRFQDSLALGLHRNPLSFSMQTGDFPADYQSRLRLAEWEFTFIDMHTGCIRVIDEDSPFAVLTGLPVCIKLAHLPRGLEKIPEWLLNEIPKHNQRRAPEAWSSRKDAEAIVDAFHSGKVKTKPEARQMFAPSLPTSSWQALWAQVVEINPNLSKPGRR